MDLIPFRNQYLITDSSKKNPLKDFVEQSFMDLTIHSSPVLDVEKAQSGTVSVMLLGIALDPYHPEHSNLEVAEQLAKSAQSKTAFLEQIQHLGGRYVFIYKNDEDFIVVGDACHFRQIYYGFIDNEIILTSSPKLFLDLFGLKLKSNTSKTSFVQSEKFKKTEQAWFGDQSPDDRLKKLLPNHYLDIKRKHAFRLPAHIYSDLLKPSSGEKSIIEKSSKLLVGTFEALNHRDYHLIQPLTAGLDTRLLLSASKPFSNSIKYYVFNREKDDSHQDARISSNIAEQLGLDFKIIHPEKLTKSFEKVFKENHIYPRILSKTRNIQYHLDHQPSDKKVININGVGGEIVRGFYGNNKRTPTLKMLLYFSKYPDNAFVKKELSTWYPIAHDYSKLTGINLLDLFYWEQRIGNWGAKYPEEQDMAIDEISPISNRALICTLYSADFKNRKKPDYRIYRKLIQHLWPETMKEEVNPDRESFKSYLKRNSLVRYFAESIKHKVSKFF